MVDCLTRRIAFDTHLLDRVKEVRLPPADTNVFGHYLGSGHFFHQCPDFSFVRTGKTQPFLSILRISAA